MIWQADGWTQHYKALVYWAQYLRSIIKELLSSHRLVFPEWDFAFGEGNDILQTLHYYVIGDPFAALSVFVPTRFMYIYYDFMVLFRLYLSGIAFSCLCFYTQKKIGRYAVMAGALTYVFCFWAIFNAARHPFFLNPMLYFPLIVFGIEKILKKDRPYLLILSVFLAAVSNFYFFYVIVLITVLYVLIRLAVKYRADFKAWFQMLWRIAGASLLGTVMGAVILLPVAIAFLSDARFSAGNAWNLFYPLSYYSGMLGRFLVGTSEGAGTGDYWLCLGYAAPAILAVFLLFMRKKQHRLLKVCYLAALVIMLFPAFGQLLNGMSYMSNKWCWALALLTAYTVSIMWRELMQLRTKDAVKLGLALGIYFLAMLLLTYSRTLAAFVCIGIAFLFLIAMFPFPNSKPPKARLWKTAKQAVALLLVVAGIANVSYFKNSAAQGNYASEAVEVSDVSGLMLTDAAAVQQAAAADGTTGFYRYSGRGFGKNGNVLSGLSSTQYYWSVSNPGIADFMSEMELIETLPQLHTGYDDRTALLSLSAVLYYVLPSSYSALLPYGFSYVGKFNVNKDITKEAKALLKEELGTDELTNAQIKVIKNATAKSYKVYRNDWALGIAYTYDTVISEDAWNSLSAVEKQEAMLEAVLLSDYDGTAGGEISLSSISPDYSVACNGSGVTLEEYGFVVTKVNATATISFEGLENGETYFSIKGLDFDGASTYQMYFGDDKYDTLNLYSKTHWALLSHTQRASIKKENFFWVEPTSVNLKLASSCGATKTIGYSTENDRRYSGRHDFTVNLDYCETAATTITVTFPKVGIYSFDSMEIICQPMDKYTQQIATLREHTLENVEIGTDRVTGAISLDKAGVLCFAIPYSAGWTAYVDSKEETLYRANIKYMALVLEAGEHEIKLVYHTPCFRAGAAVTAAGFLCFGAVLFICESKRRRKKPAKPI